MLACLIIGMLSGKESTLQAVKWCRLHISYLKKCGLKLANGVASYDTHQRLLRNIDTDQFAEEFIVWANHAVYLFGVQLAIDGKGLRGGTDRIRGGKTPYMLNIVDTETKVIVASLPINEKTNEMTAITDALALISVAGNLFTIDAAGTYVQIMRAIQEEDGHFVLLVKRNNPEAYENLVAFFEKNRKVMEKGEDFETGEAYDYDASGWQSEKNRERHEHRYCERVVIDSDDPGSKDSLWREVLGESVLGKNADLFKTVGVLRTVRIPIEYDKDGNDVTPTREEFILHGSGKCGNPKEGDSEKCDIQVVGVISDLELKPKDILLIKRTHWICEAAHNIIDRTFKEDASNASMAKYNTSLVRKCAFNIVKLAVLNGYIDKQLSTPMEMIALTEDTAVMRKILFDPFPRFHGEGYPGAANQ